MISRAVIFQEKKKLIKQQHSIKLLKNSPSNPFAIQNLAHSVLSSGTELNFKITDKFWSGWIPEFIMSLISFTWKFHVCFKITYIF